MSEQELEQQLPGDDDGSGLPSPGDKLRRLREERGLSQAEVGEALHLTVHYINALENDDYGKLPGLTFAKGYLKTYARYLDADIDETAEQFEALIAARGEGRHRITPVQRPQADNDQHLGWLFAAAVLLILALGAAWWFGREGGFSFGQAEGGDGGEQITLSIADSDQHHA